MAVALSDDYSLIVTENADVFSVPKKPGGHVAVPLPQSVPVLLDKHEMFGGERVTMVTANFGHSACVTQEGSVWSWGAPPPMQHEQEWPLVRTGTQLLQTLSPALMATCYADVIVILTADGCVRRRNVRSLHSTQDKTEPKVVCYNPFWFSFVHIDMIASGKEHIMALAMLITFCS